MFALFLLVQSVGIYLGSKLITVPEIVPETSAAAGGFVFAYILVATGVILLVIRFWPAFLKVMEVLAILFSTEIFFEVLFLDIVPADTGFQAAILLALAITALRVLKRNILTQNTAMLLSIMGVGSLLGASLGIVPATVLLGLLAAYDVVAVFKTKHMVTMAKEITKQNLAFTLAIPTKKHVFQLGGGDLVLPLIFTVSVLREAGLASALITMTCSMLGLLVLFSYLVSKPGRAWPALPPVAIGAMIGFGISQLLVMGGVL